MLSSAFAAGVLLLLRGVVSFARLTNPLTAVLRRGVTITILATNVLFALILEILQALPAEKRWAALLAGAKKTGAQASAINVVMMASAPLTAKTVRLATRHSRTAGTKGSRLNAATRLVIKPVAILPAETALNARNLRAALMILVPGHAGPLLSAMASLIRLVRQRILAGSPAPSR